MKLNRNVTYDNSERLVIRKERISREVSVSLERDHFSCPIGTIYYFEDVPPHFFGVSAKEHKVSNPRYAINGWREKFFGDEV